MTKQMAEQMAEQHPTKLLVDRVQSGDRPAFNELVERHRGALETGIERQIQSRRRGDIEAEDILQETVVQALRSIDRFQWRGENSFFLWLCGIARNVILKVSKKARSGRILRLPEQIAGSDPSPSRAMQRDERFDRLEAALASLRAEYREVLRLARLEGLKVKEIAGRMNRSENAVRHLMARAVVQLRASFGDTESLNLPDRLLREDGDTHGED